MERKKKQEALASSTLAEVIEGEKLELHSTVEEFLNARALNCERRQSMEQSGQDSYQAL